MLRITVAFDEDQEQRLHHKLDRIIRLLERLMFTQGTLNTEIMDMTGELQTLTAQVSANTDAEESAIVLLNALHQRLEDAIASGDPAQLTALASQLSASKDALAAAVVANTPAA